ncbi:MAG TPA: hypothetical protein VFV33_16035 [Gemmatimonadaceae bacterium]|nr:hypothetical protein [Gemmatimonadaceae bacterium]
MSTTHGARELLALVAVTAIVGACSVSDATSPAQRLQPTLLASHMALDPGPEQVIVCKLYEHGTPLGPGAKFTYTIDDSANGSIDRSGTVALGPDQCAILPTMGTQTHEHLVVVKEQVPAGYYSMLRVVEYHAGGYTATDLGQAEMGTAYMHGDRGFTLAFTNHKRGSDGCTYYTWRAETMLGAWPAPLAPDTPFSAVFDDAFPGMTLRDVMLAKGSGLTALGRETVAALLNAQAGFGWFTRYDVVTMFNNVYPSTASAYTKLQYRFEAKNMLTCPLLP